MQQYIKLSEAAKTLDLSVQAMYHLCNLPDFPVLKFKTKKSFTYRINKAGFAEWIKKNSNKGCTNE